MIHNLKIRSCFADAVLSGEKNFEIRYNADRGFQKGDIVRFNVIDDEGNPTSHPLRRETFDITYVFSGVGLKPEYVVFGIKKLEGERDENR